MLSLWKSISALWSGQIANHRIDMSFNFVVFFFKVIVLRTFGWISTRVPYLLRPASEINSTETAPTSAQFQNLDFFFFSFNFKAYLYELPLSQYRKWATLYFFNFFWEKKLMGPILQNFAFYLEDIHNFYFHPSLTYLTGLFLFELNS